ncbi:MAG TPA: lytic transglycosylase domain-containing protein [Nevskiaceae bacterium]|nr:lytic transglycosylase domain-containing protein [Nevskiaceae bacterium]
MLRGFVSGMFLLLAMGVHDVTLATARADKGDIYIYKQQGGSRLYTDQKRSRPGHTYIGTYGRPTAYVSCGDSKTLRARADSYQHLIDKHAAAFNVPAALVKAVMHVESCFDKRAISRVGARGLMQLMPDTATLLGVKDSFDPGQNIEGGAKYLSMMRQKFPKDWNLVLAAYNAGPGAVDKYGDIPPYPETQSYVKRVMGLYQKGIAAARPASLQQN